MGLVVNTNVAAINTSRILRRSTLDLNRSLQRLSSGLRINRAADDAAGLAIAEGFSARVRGLAVAQRNAQDGISLVQTAEGALGEITNIVQRIRELAVQSANGTNSDTPNRAALQAEVTQLLSQIDGIAANTEFNNVVLLNGSAGTLTIQAGPENVATQQIGISFATILGTVAGIFTGGTPAVNTQAAAQTAITQTDTALTNLGTNRATLGAIQNRLEFTVATLAIEEENSAASESAIRDADIARETVRFTRNQILVTAGTAVLAQANLVPQTALQLLA